MWMLNFIPDFVIHVLLVMGVLGIIAGFFLSVIPFINTYKLPVQILSILILALGLYLEGGLTYKEKTAKEIAELQAKLAEANAKAEQTNVQIVTKIVKDTKIITQKGEDIIKIIEKEVPKYNDRCVIPRELIDAHNRAATLNTDPVVEQKDVKKTEDIKDQKDTKKLTLPPRTSK